jgi:hypothetical protein
MSDIPTGNSGQARKYTPGFGLEGVDYRLLNVEGGKMAVPVDSTQRPQSPETVGLYGMRGVDFELVPLFSSVQLVSHGCLRWRDSMRYAFSRAS